MMIKTIDFRLNKAVFTVFLTVFCSLWLNAQQSVDAGAKTKGGPALKEAQDLVAEGNEELLENDFALAESSYRQAVAKDPANLSAKYNMGNNYYKNERYAEGMARYAQAVEVAQTKAEKHRAFHNLGNALYKQKDFKKAVEAYKNALRNDPTDDETRYNLALAKKEDEKNGGGGDDNNDQKDKNKDQNKDKNKDNKENKNDKGDQKEGDDGKPKDEGDKGDEKKDQGDEKKDDKGKPDEKKGDQKNEGDKKEQPQQPQSGKGQLSPQQVKSLLEAMKNEENKVQDKMNAKKVKGSPVKTDKDW